MLFDLTIYEVSYWKHDSYKDIVYYGSDYDLALKEFNSFSSSDLDYDTYGKSVVIELRKKTDIYKWVSDSDSDPAEYSIEKYYDDDSLYEITEEGEFNEEKDKLLETPKSIKEREEADLEDSIKNEVIDYIKSITTENKNAAYLGSTFYALKPYKDGFILFRVADHFFNIQNVNLGKNVLYDYFQDIPEFNTYRNIYGFISINILNNNSVDRKGFRGNFKEWKEDNVDKSKLVDFIDLDISKPEDNWDDWQKQLDDAIYYMEEDINEAIKNKLFEEESENMAIENVESCHSCADTNQVKEPLEMSFEDCLVFHGIETGKVGSYFGHSAIIREGRSNYRVESLDNLGIVLRPSSAFKNNSPEGEFFVSYVELIEKFKSGEISVSGFDEGDIVDFARTINTIRHCKEIQMLKDKLVQEKIEKEALLERIKILEQPVPAQELKPEIIIFADRGSYIAQSAISYFNDNNEDEWVIKGLTDKIAKEEWASRPTSIKKLDKENGISYSEYKKIYKESWESWSKK